MRTFNQFIDKVVWERTQLGNGFAYKHIGSFTHSRESYQIHAIQYEETVLFDVHWWNGTEYTHDGKNASESILDVFLDAVIWFVRKHNTEYLLTKDVFGEDNDSVNSALQMRLNHFHTTERLGNCIQIKRV